MSKAVLAALVAIVLNPYQAASAQTYPTHRVQMLVPLSAGTVLDSIARVVAEEFSTELGQSVVVLNRTGAGGIVAFTEAAAAEPDGHTLMFSGQSQLTIQPNVQANLPYPVEAFAPVCQLFETPFAIVVGPNSPVTDFNTFLARARTAPGSLSFGHSGAATVPHIQMAMLGKAAGFETVDVPYRSLGDTIKDVIAGTIDTAVLSIGSFSGANLRVIAVFNTKRSATFPDVPTVAELGYPITFTAVNGLFALQGSPRPVMERLEAACAKAFASQRFREMAARLDINAELLVGGDFAKRLADERREMRTFVNGLKLNGR